MDPSFWKARWSSRQIGFHQPTTNPYLERHAAVLARGASSAREPRRDGRGRVLVPLAGKSLDMVYLAGLGHEVVGIEIVEEAVAAFFEEQRLVPTRTPAGPFERWSSGPITILRGDFFAATPELVGPVTAAYDRAALIALPPDLRARYAPVLRSLLPEGAPLLLVTMTAEPDDGQGPPFSVGAREVHTLFGSRGAPALLDERDILDESPRFRERGAERLLERVWLLGGG